MSLSRFLILLMIIMFSHLFLNGVLSEATAIKLSELKAEKELMNSFEEFKETPLGRYMTDENLTPVKYDTLYTNQSSIESFLTKGDQRKEAVMNFLHNNSRVKNSGFCFLNDVELYEVIFNFNLLNNIPIGIYRDLIKEGNTDKAFKIEINKTQRNGKYLITRKFEKLYGINELGKYIQIIVIGYGANYPTVYLLTYSKEELKVIDEKIIYSFSKAERESKTIIKRLKTCMDESFEKLVVYELNEEQQLNGDQTNYVKDTIKHSYLINNFGEIEINNN